MKKFLLINPFGIGDVLFTTPVIRVIKKNFPSSFVSYWCNERVSDILKNNPEIERIFALSRGDLKRIYNRSPWEGMLRFLTLLYRIKKERFEVCLDFSLDHRYSLVAKGLGIKRRIGFNYKNRGRFLTDKVNLEGYKSKHVVEYYLDLARLLDIKPESSNLYLNVSEEEKIKGINTLRRFGLKSEDLIIGIAPGAGESWGKDAPLKHWPALRYAKLVNKIGDELKAAIVILGDEAERPIADIIVNTAEHKPVDLVGKTTLEELMAIINNLDILITNDGGPLHIAVSLGVKTVSIFGPVDDLVYGPYPKDNKHIVIKSDLACQPCYQEFRLSPCENDRECLKDIPVERVFAAVRSLIA